MPRTGGNQPKPKKDCFTWTDDEVELLLKVTNGYKVQKSTESVDWESVQSKYGDILDMFQAAYPNSENAAALGKEYPHKPEDITKATLSTKLKAVRKKFRLKQSTREGKVDMAALSCCITSSVQKYGAARQRQIR